MIALPIAGTNAVHQVRPSKIIALGLNYKDHVHESITQQVTGQSQDLPTEPVLFGMSPNILIGPGDEIILPSLLEQIEDPRVDYEGELAIIIKDRCKDLSPDEAYHHILGFTCFNDVSCRNLQTADRSGWFRGKSLDTFGPIGPVLVPPEEIGNPQNLAISTRLNGKTVQESNTAEMIFSLKEIVSYISRYFTLEAGDIIPTGTPSGVGPLAAGDSIEIEIEGIGVLKNGVRKEGQ